MKGWQRSVYDMLYSHHHARVVTKSRTDLIIFYVRLWYDIILHLRKKMNV